MVCGSLARNKGNSMTKTGAVTVTVFTDRLHPILKTSFHSIDQPQMHHALTLA